MQTILDEIKQYIGIPDFYRLMPTTSQGYQSYGWDYGAMLEYAVAGILFIVVISNVFKLVRGFFK